jgi:hypothetical protein
MGKPKENWYSYELALRAVRRDATASRTGALLPQIGLQGVKARGSLVAGGKRWIDWVDGEARLGQVFRTPWVGRDSLER